jgi:hypothetical protein
MTSKARVQKYRANLRSQQCGRLEVWIGNNLIDAIRTMARHQNDYVWVVVKEALEAHVTRRYAAVVTAPHDN